MKQTAYVEKRRDVAKTLSSFSFFLMLSLTVLILSAAGLAQELAATLTGTVTDASGALVPNATLVVHSEDTGADVRRVTTSSTGNFNITNLPAGKYTVTVQLEGFQKFVASSVSSTLPKNTLSMCN
jgi:hypothetical protein